MWNQFKSPTTRWPSTQEVDRLYPRFALLRGDVCTIKINDVVCGAMIELSYGGCSFQVEESDERRLQLMEQNGSTIRVQINWHGKKHVASATISHIKNGRAGLTFLHDKSRDFMFLQEIIAPLCFGAEMAQTNQHRAESVALRMDGLRNGHLSIRNSANGKTIEEVWLRYKRHKISFELQLTPRGLQTRHDIGPGGELTEMTKTAGIDEEILRTGLLIIHGFAQETRNPVLLQAYEFALKAASKTLNFQLKPNQTPMKNTG